MDSLLLCALIIAFVLDLLLYFFILLPLSSAEVSLAYTDESLIGQVGKVIVPVPVDGFGEIVIETVNGLISKRAAVMKMHQLITEKKYLVIEVKEWNIYCKRV